MQQEHLNIKQIRKTRFSLYALYLLFLFSSFAAFAQGSFTASVDKKRVPVSGTIQVTYSLSNSDGRNFTPPSFHDFTVLSGPSQSSSMQIINGNVSRSIAYSYYLKPNKEGTLTIDPASILVNGKSISSNAVTIEVTKADAKDPSQKGQDIYAQIAESVFLKLTVDKKEVYQGEQVTVTYKFYNRATTGNVSVSELPSYTGFWVQELEVPENVQFTPELYDGMQYNVAVAKRDALFPQRAGEIEIPAMELQTTVRVRSSNSRGYMDDFFGNYQDVPYKFKSNTIKIKVKPLPTAETPPSFSGAVGNYKMDVTLDKTEVSADDKVTLKINIEGTGNVKMLDMPKVSLPADLEAFDPVVSEKISKKNNIIAGSKTYEYLIIPRRGGEFKIPPIEFSYFDLSKQRYVTQQSQEFVVKVTGSTSNPSTPTITGINKEEVELLGEDIRYIKTMDLDLKKNREFLFTSPLFAGVFAAPFLLLGLLFAYRRREQKLSGNVALLKNRRANKEATRRLKKAKQYLAEQNRKSFFDEITRAIWGYLGDKLNISQSALSREQVQKTLTEKNIPAETIQHVFKTLDDAEMALFSPVSDGQMDKAYNDASEILSKLDAEL